MVFFLCIGNEFLLNTALSQSDFFCLQKNFEWAGKGETSLLEVLKIQHFMPGHFSIAQIANTLPFTDSSLHQLLHLPALQVFMAAQCS